MPSLLARTLAECRKVKRITGITEKYIHYAHVRSDLFGFVDLISIDPSQGIIAIQCCNAKEKNQHLNKIASQPQRDKALAWLKWAKIELWCWSLRKVKRGGKKQKWCVQVYEITSEALQPECEKSA